MTMTERPCPFVVTPHLPGWRRCAWRLFVALALGIGAGPVLAQAPGSATPPRVEWNALSPGEQQVLAPLRAQWDSASAVEQTRFRRVAARWQNAPQARRDAISQRLTRWTTMSPQQRAAVSARAQRFQQLSPQEQHDVRAAARRFRALSPIERKALLERYEKRQRGGAPSARQNPT